MSHRIKLNPPQAEFDKFGLLSYVDQNERNRIMDLPYGQFHRELVLLEREISQARKKEKEAKKNSVQYSYAAPKSKLIEEWHKKIGEN